MYFFNNKKKSRWLGYLFALFIVVFTIYVTYNTVQQIKVEEEKKVKVFATSVEILSMDSNLSSKVTQFLLAINKNNTSIPVLILDKNDNVFLSKNIDSIKINDKKLQKEIINDMKSYYNPIVIKLPGGNQYIYYKNSTLLTQLQYYPIILITLIGLFIWFTIWYFRTLKQTEQSFLWVGLAKETAHQIGTPLSSIIGWIEILKLSNIDKDAIIEIEKDIERLKHITDRFSKIGSYPELKGKNIVTIIDQSVLYLRNRISSHIELTFIHTINEAYIETNPSLFSWVIENLVKNAVDAIKSKGIIEIHLSSQRNKYIIDIKDSGQGILLNKRKQVFEPGFTTKKRGWGLGLSLVKRIIEEYHNGKVMVLKSELNKGTTFRLILNKIK